MSEDQPDDYPPFLDPHIRPRGILTKKDREYLLNKDEYEPKSQSEKRYRIRNRVTNSFKDFIFLEYFTSDEDREKIFEELFYKDRTLADPVVTALSFIYSGAELSDQDFEQLVHHSIEERELEKNPDDLIDVSVDIEINREQPSVEDVIDRFIEKEATEEDFRFILRHQDVRAPKRLLEELEKADKEMQIIQPYRDEPQQMTLDMLRDLVDRTENNES